MVARAEWNVGYKKPPLSCDLNLREGSGAKLW